MLAVLSGWLQSRTVRRFASADGGRWLWRLLPLNLATLAVLVTGATLLVVAFGGPVLARADRGHQLPLGGTECLVAHGGSGGGHPLATPAASGSKKSSNCVAYFRRLRRAPCFYVHRLLEHAIQSA